MPAINAAASEAKPRPLVPYPKTTILMALNTILNVIFAAIASGGSDSQVCSGPPTIPEKACLTPYSYFVIWTTVTILLCMVNDVEPDVLLMFATIMLSILPGPCTGNQEGPDCTIISAREAFQGFAAPAILAAATLLVYARCLEETKVVEKLITPCLRGATNEVSAVARLAFPTFFFSSFLNSTPIVAMLIPVCEAWCARSGFKLQVVLMPLSFAAMLGGLTSLLGTASNMVLNAQIEADDEPPIQPFTFFSQAPAGVPAALAGITVMSFLAPVFLGKLGGDAGDIGDDGNAANALPAPMSVRGRASSGMRGSTWSGKLTGKITAADEHVHRGYEIEVMVMDNCQLLGQACTSIVAACTGAHPETRGSANPYLDLADDDGGTSLAADGIAPVKIVWLMRKDGTKCDGSNANIATTKLEVGDRIMLSLSAHVVPPLRKIVGLTAAAEMASEQYKHQPKRRCLYEAALTAKSPLIGLDHTTAQGHPALQYTVLWAVRASPMEVGMSLKMASTKGGPQSVKRGLSAKILGSLSSSAGPLSGLQVGDCLLLEADEDFQAQHWRIDPSYSMITIVPGSLPPESGEDAKPAWLVAFQFYASVVSLLLMVVVSIMDWMAILPLSFLLMFSLVAIGCITQEQAWVAIKYRVILTIMAAFGLGAALDNTDVADIIAAGLVTFGQASGSFLFLLTVFTVTALLSFLVGSTPAIILLYAAVRLTESTGVEIGRTMLALMLGAVCALATPVGFATNLMVQARAGYVFADFFLLGSIVTAVVGLVSCTIINILPEDMLPTPITNLTKVLDGASGDDYIHNQPRMAFDRNFAHYAL